MKRDEWMAVLVSVALAIGVGWLGLGSYSLDKLTKENSLPDRTVVLPAPKPLLDSTKTQAKTRGLVVYAKEPVPFKSPTDRGSYLLYGYVGASQALSAPVAIYVRAEDPSEDPACKALIAPLPAQDGAVDSTVYVCEEGQNDLRIALLEFVGTSLSSFCSLEDKLQQGRHGVDATFFRGGFWIGIRWTPLFPHPLAFSFSNVTAYGPLPSATPPLCAPASRSR